MFLLFAYLLCAVLYTYHFTYYLLTLCYTL